MSAGEIPFRRLTSSSALAIPGNISTKSSGVGCWLDDSLMWRSLHLVGSFRLPPPCHVRLAIRRTRQQRPAPSSPSEDRDLAEHAADLAGPVVVKAKYSSALLAVHSVQARSDRSDCLDSLIQEAIRRKSEPRRAPMALWSSSGRIAVMTCNSPNVGSPTTPSTAGRSSRSLLRSCWCRVWNRRRHLPGASTSSASSGEFRNRWQSARSSRHPQGYRRPARHRRGTLWGRAWAQQHSSSRPSRASYLRCH
jgi:hypothetical protein